IANAGFFNVSENRDPDVFMFTSNQGYLQSLGEFAFLPRLSQWNSQPGSRISTILKNAPGASPGAAHAATPQAILNNACAWRTYPVDHEFYEDCASVGIGRSSVLTVNPFSDNGHILLSAFANTPCDYWTTGRIVAGARNEELADGLAAIVDKMGDKNQTSGDRIDAGDSQKHMFCEYSYESSSRMTAAELDSIIRYVTSFTHTGDGVGSWEETYDNLFGVQMAVLNPNDDNAAKDFMGQTLNSCPLFSVDRKFLYAYWYDSMVANQNNLLLFARGEYSMPVTDIGEYAFCGCALITSVPIPNSVTNIAANAFWDCNKLTSIIFNGNAPTASTLAFSGVAPDCTAYIKKNSTGWGVDIPGMWKGLNVRYVPSEDEILEAVVAANERGTGYVTVVGDLPYVDVASGVTLKVLAPEQSAAALAEKLTAVPHEAGQSAALFKVEASTAADGVVSLTVGLDEYAVDPDAAAAEIVGAENMAVFSTAGDGEPVPVNLSSAKPGLYYGIAAANDIAGLAEAAETVPLVRAGPEGVTVPVTKPIGGAAFFKVVVSDRAR
ncbi:MAG: leucine-rich repeat protein, partial [Kiritimatiellae bacterium]|nr:leucine-rich repeat protein [Kiritimatiellia bacterium]